MGSTTSAAGSQLGGLASEGEKVRAGGGLTTLARAKGREDKPVRHSSDLNRFVKESFRSSLKAALKIGKTSSSTDCGMWFSKRIENVAQQRLAETGMQSFADCKNAFEAKYELREVLGQGTSGLVKKCVNRKTGELFAVKTVRTGDTEILKAIKNEFLLQRELSHPNVVRVHELFYDPVTSHAKIVMELVNGVQLFEDVESNGPFTGWVLCKL